MWTNVGYTMGKVYDPAEYDYYMDVATIAVGDHCFFASKGSGSSFWFLKDTTWSDVVWPYYPSKTGFMTTGNVLYPHTFDSSTVINSSGWYVWEFIITEINWASDSYGSGCSYVGVTPGDTENGSLLDFAFKNED